MCLSVWYGFWVDQRTVPTIVITHTFCASRDTRISYQRCLLILGFHMTSRPPCWCPKQRKVGHVGAPTKSSGNLTLLLCKRFLLFSLKNMAVDHVSENQQYRDIFVRFKTMQRKQNFSKCSWYPKRKLGVTTHFFRDN